MVPPLPSLREYSTVWGLSRDFVRPEQKIMHPGPINRGTELADDVADDGGSVILQQVESGLAVRMAILYHVLAPESGEEVT